MRWVADQLGHADPALTLRVYAHVIPNDEQELSFLDFGGPGRPYTAPLDLAECEDENTPIATDRGAYDFSGAPSKTRTCDLQVRNTKPTQEVTRGCVSCIARACKERHQAAPVTAPGSIRLQLQRRNEWAPARRLTFGSYNG